MKIKYYPETDTLYIKIKDTPSIESEEISNGIIVSFDEKGNIVGIEILSQNMQISCTFEVVGKCQN